jgi:hypothetical protein
MTNRVREPLARAIWLGAPTLEKARGIVDAILTESDRVGHPGWVTREEMAQVIEQINRARRLEMTLNFESGRRYERELMRGQTTGQDGVTVKLDWEGVAR